MVAGFVTFMLSILNYNNLQNDLVKKLYRHEVKAAKDSKIEVLKTSKCDGLR